MSLTFQPRSGRISTVSPGAHVTQVATRKRSTRDKGVFYTCESCYLMFPTFVAAVGHFRTSRDHAEELRFAVSNSDSGADYVDLEIAAAASMITRMAIVPEPLIEQSSRGTKRKAISTAVPSPEKRPRVVHVDFEDVCLSGPILTADANVL